jgi:uncharacterized membrane protein YagU involved in acid resistance
MELHGQAGTPVELDSEPPSTAARTRYPTEVLKLKGESMTLTGAEVSRPRAALPLGLVAGLVGGVVDLIPTLGMQAAMGVPPTRVLQAIASGAMGRSAYTGGVGSAVLGTVLHFALSIACGIVFALIATRSEDVRRRPWLAGPVFGVIFYAIMRYVVLPLSPVAFPLSSAPAIVATSVFFHAFLFGLPIALTVWFMTRKENIVAGHSSH